MRVKYLNLLSLLSLVIFALSSASCSKYHEPSPSVVPPAADEDDDSDRNSTNPTKVSFIAFGDWGTGDDEQADVAEAIGNYCNDNDCDFIVTLGDNFLSNGVDSTDDELWQSRYHDVYDFLDLPFYAALGNHDHNGNIGAEIDYSSVDPNWHMLAQDYSFTMPGSEEPFLEFFVLDSNYPHFRYDGDDEEEDGKDAPTWLYDALTSSSAKWKILVMHHPFYNNGNHGDDDQDNLEVMLGKNPEGKPNILCDEDTSSRFDLALSGHAHSFAHLQSSEDGCLVNQFIIGTGGQGLKSVDEDDPRVISTGSFHGFGHFEVTKEAITFSMIKSDGSVFYETSF